MSSSIRVLGRDDVDFAVNLTVEEGWNYTHLEVERLLELDPDGSFVFEDGRPLGFITTVTYGRTGVIGHLVVSKHGRGKGVGGHLMQAALDYMEGKGVESMLVFSSDDGRRVYRKRGFESIHDIHCLHAKIDRRHIGKPDPRCAPLCEDDLAEVTALDEELFGDDRGKVIRVLFRDFPKGAFKVERDGRILGYIFGRPDHVGYDLGPWACTSADPGDADALFRSVISTFGEGIVYMGVFAENAEAMRIAKSIPMERYWDIPLMAKGKPRYTSDIKSLYNVAAIELG